MGPVINGIGYFFLGMTAASAIMHLFFTAQNKRFEKRLALIKRLQTAQITIDQTNEVAIACITQDKQLHIPEIALMDGPIVYSSMN